MRRNGLLFAIILLVCSAIGLAQINTGKISGFVTDASGALVTNVPVTATNDTTGVVTRTITTDTGEYLLNFLVPGTYHVEVEKQGFQKAIRSSIVVDAGGTNRVDFSLMVEIPGKPSKSRPARSTSQRKPRSYRRISPTRNWIRCPTWTGIRSTR